MGRFLVVGRELARRGWLTERVDAESFAACRSYLDRLGYPNPYGLLCPALVKVDPAAAAAVDSNIPDSPPTLTTPPAAIELPPPLTGAKDVFGAYGRFRLGPILSAFAHWVWRQPEAKDATLFGVARDGCFLAAALRAANPHGAVSEVWLNRRLSLTAAIASADDHDGLNNLLVRARATPATLREAMEELGLSSLPPPTGIGLDGPLTPKPLGQFFDWVATRIPRQLLQDHSTILRTRILAHLRAQGALSGPSLALVDIGYAGNIQRALARMMMIEGMSLPIWAAYAVTTPGLLWTLRQDHCTATGFLTHLGSPTWLANPFVRSRELFEAFCGAPLGPLLDYDEDGAPRLEKTILSTEQLEELARLQKGALDCCLSTEPPLSQESARMAMLALIAAPRPEEAAAIGRWLYDDPLAIGKPRRLIERIDSDPRPILWPQGALAAEKR